MRLRTSVLLIGVLLARGSAARCQSESCVRHPAPRGVLRFLDLPAPWARLYLNERFRPEDIDPAEMIERIRAIGPLGAAVLAAVAVSGYRVVT